MIISRTSAQAIRDCHQPDNVSQSEHTHIATFGHLSEAEFQARKTQQITALLTWHALAAAGVECTASEGRTDV